MLLLIHPQLGNGFHRDHILSGVVGIRQIDKNIIANGCDMVDVAFYIECGGMSDIGFGLFKQELGGIRITLTLVEALGLNICL